MHFLENIGDEVRAAQNGAAPVELDVVLTPKPFIDVHLVDASGAPALPGLLAEELLAPHLFAELQAVATESAPAATLPLYPYVRLQQHGLGALKKPASNDPEDDVLGRITLNRTGPAHVSLVAFHQVLATQVVPAGTTNVTIAVSPSDLTALFGTLTARFVMGPEGTPLAGHSHLAYSRWSRPRGFERGIETDDAAVLRMERVLPGHRWLRFEPDRLPPVDPPEVGGFASPPRTPPAQHLSVEIPAGGQVSLGDITAAPSVRFKAAVVDASGTPRITAIRFLEVLADGSISADSSATFAGTSSDGLRASLERPGRYLVEVMGSSHGHTAESGIWCGDPVQIEVGTEPFEDLTLTVQRGIPLKVQSPHICAGLFTGVKTVITDANGIVRRPAVTKEGYLLTPGEYTVALTFNGEAFASETVTLGPSGARIFFDIDLPY